MEKETTGKIVLDKQQSVGAYSSVDVTKKKNYHAVALGRLGGKAGTGAAKARSFAHAKAAADKRWAIYHARKQAEAERESR